jgi:hypothetical protein
MGNTVSFEVFLSRQWDSEESAASSRKNLFAASPLALLSHS